VGVPAGVLARVVGDPGAREAPNSSCDPTSNMIPRSFRRFSSRGFQFVAGSNWSQRSHTSGTSAPLGYSNGKSQKNGGRAGFGLNAFPQP
jgi:hypothetical protein